MDYMEYRENWFNSPAMTAVLNTVACVISPILFIWAVNTLFPCQISYSFKTWLAGFVLIILVRFHFRGADFLQDRYDEFDEFDDAYFDDMYHMDREERKAKLKAKLITYPGRKNKNEPPEGAQQ